MSDNPQPVPAQGHGQEFALPGYRYVVLEGRDAATFAHAQFMNDVKSLPPAAWQWSGWLTPKGRVIAIFALLKLAEDRIGLLLLEAEAQAFTAALQRFVFRSKVSPQVVPSPVLGRFSTPGDAVGNAVAWSAARGIELDFSGDGGPRTLRIATEGAAPIDAAALARWTAFDLAHGLPRLPPSQENQWTPQMLSLERLRAFSVKKGCYPGQEIVARTHFLGQAKRGLALFQADAAVAAGSEIRDDERVLGTVVSAEADLVLAVLPLERDAVALRAGGIALHEQALLGGLAR